MIKLKTNSHVARALEEKRFFKLVCGASLTDLQIVENLSFIFTLAGAHVIDLAPTADVIFAARKGIRKALSTQDRINPAPTVLSPLLMASVQLDIDPHFRKVKVSYNLCDLCGACIKVCPTDAFKIDDSEIFKYSIERCFGCGICPGCCHVNALSMMDIQPTPKEKLLEMRALGIESIELHFGKNYLRIKEIWSSIKDLVKDLKLLSFSIGSNLLNDTEIREAAKLSYLLAGSGIILQCDGTPMSGHLLNGNNRDNSSLLIARVIQEEKLPVYLQISGGTNQSSYSRAIESGIDINGVAIGSHARKLLMPYLTSQEISKNKLEEAVKIARSLVQSARRHIGTWAQV